MGNVYQTYEAVLNLFTNHITEILNYATVLLCREPGLEIIRVEPLNDLKMVFLEPGTALLARKFEDRITELLPGLESTARLLALWIGSPSSERTVIMPPT